MYYSIFIVFYTSVSESCSDVILRSEALPVIVDHITNSNRNKVTLNKAKIAINILFNLSMVRRLHALSDSQSLSMTANIRYTKTYY